MSVPISYTGKRWISVLVRKWLVFQNTFKYMYGPSCNAKPNSSAWDMEVRIYFLMHAPTLIKPRSDLDYYLGW